MSAEVDSPVANGHTSRDATSNEIQQAPPPPHIEATLAQISSYRNVRGVMILSRKQAQSAAESEEAGGHVGGVVHSTGSVFDGEGGRRYARTVETLVENVSRAVGDCEEGDELRFMRIRTKRHELLITPDLRYLLIVLQDPE